MPNRPVLFFKPRVDDKARFGGRGNEEMAGGGRLRFHGLMACGAALVLLAAGVAAAATGSSGQRHVRQAAPKHAAAAVFTARATPARLARGRYLVEDVINCFDCHSPHEYVNGEWIGKPGMKGAGQFFPASSLELPPGSKVYAPNITPDKATGIGTWTDAEIATAMRDGVAKGGRPLFDLMPYWQFRVLTSEDLKSIIVYLRSIPPVHKALPMTKLPFPVHVDMHNDLVPPLPRDASAELRHGWYLVRIAGCEDCHTPLLPGGKRPPSKIFAGGMVFRGPYGAAVSLNITPSAEGIGSWTEAMFSRTLRTGRVEGTGRKLNTIMPFHGYKHMTDADIRAIYAYLRTVPPVPAK